VADTDAAVEHHRVEIGVVGLEAHVALELALEHEALQAGGELARNRVEHRLTVDGGDRRMDAIPTMPAILRVLDVGGEREPHAFALHAGVIETEPARPRIDLGGELQVEPDAAHGLAREYRVVHVEPLERDVAFEARDAPAEDDRQMAAHRRMRGLDDRELLEHLRDATELE